MKELGQSLESDDIYKLAKDNSNEIVLDYNVLDDSIYHLTNRVTQVFGIPQKLEHAQDYMIRYGVIQPESTQEFQDIFKRIRNGEPSVERILRARDARGNMLWIYLQFRNFFGDDGKPNHAVGVVRDITLERDAQLRCVDEEQYREVLMRESLIYYEVNLTKKKVLFGMEYLLKALGVSYTDDYEESLELLISNIVYPEERALVAEKFSVENLLACHARGQNMLELEYRRLNGNGSVMWVRGNAYLSEGKNDGDILLYFYISDINDKKMREESVRSHSESDSLTGLYNRPTAEYKIQKALEENLSEGRLSALLVMNLSNFKKINDQMGHFWGDAFLAELGHHLKGMCAAGDIAGRDGVEFILYLDNPGSVQYVQEKADEIRRSAFLDRSEVLREFGFSVTVQFACAPEDGITYEVLYNCAVQRTESPVMELKSGIGEDIFTHILQILYQAQDLNSAVIKVLEHVTRHYGFSIGCMYEAEPDKKYRCNFEWSSPGVDLIHENYKILNKEQAGFLMRGLGADNMLMVLPKDLSPGDPAYGRLCIRILYVFKSGDVPQGFICFDSYGQADYNHLLKEKAVIQRIAQILEVLQSGKTSNSELWENSFILQQIVDGFKSCTYIIDPESFVLKYVNQNTRQNISGAMPGTRCYESIRGRKAPCDDCPIKRMIANGTNSDRSEMYLDRYGMWAQINASLMTVPGGKVYGVFNGFDFSDHKKEDNLQIEGLDAFIKGTSLYDALAVSTDDYIFMCDMATQLFYFPKKMMDEFALPGQILENAVEIWAAKIHEDDRTAFLDEMNRIFKGQTDTHSMEYRILNKDGVWVWVSARGHMERDKHDIPTMFAGVLTNLGNKKSKIDHLTGLQDKYEFEVRTRSMLANGVEKGVLLVLGLDNFRHINNLYGWDFGDSVLKESAQRILAPLPEKLQLYKLDGDKFGVFIADGDINDVEEYYHSLFLLFKHNRQFGEHRYFCTVSGGCAVMGEKTSTFSELFKKANLALDYSKREGKNRLTVFDDTTMSENERILILLSQLHESVDRGMDDFELYFQPQVEPSTYKTNSAEALLRWHSPDRGIVAPEEFIPLLEQSGLIHKVGRWVIKKAADICRKWRAVLPEFTISVNVSYMQLRDQAFLPYLRDEIKAGNIDPAALHLEITESCIADGSRSLKSAFETMRGMGFVIEMDDFGTGYSSLEILKNAPADVVKIDRAFVRDITHSNFDATFIQFVVTLCHSVNIKVCLEGVETWDEYYLVESMELDLIQGFLFGKTQTQAEFEEEYLKKEQK